MKNIYDGTVVLDESGQATVQLPDYFEALNSDFRYQLTSIGQFSPVYVSSEVSHNTFAISGGRAGQKVSWQVTGIRQDAVANSDRVVTEVAKEPQNQGLYLNPEAFGLPANMRINYRPEVPPVPLSGESDPGEIRWSAAPNP